MKNVVFGLSELKSEAPELNSGMPKLNSERRELNSRTPKLNSWTQGFDSWIQELNSDTPELNFGIPKLNSETREIDFEIKESNCLTAEFNSCKANWTVCLLDKQILNEEFENLIPKFSFRATPPRNSGTNSACLPDRQAVESTTKRKEDGEEKIIDEKQKQCVRIASYCMCVS